MIDKLKNSRFIRLICDQINRMPPVLVGLLTMVAYIVGAGLLGVLIGAGFIAALIGLLFLIMFLTAIPCGIGIAMFGAAVHIGYWKNYSYGYKLPTGYIIKQSVKIWGLSVLLGCIALMFFPGQRHLLHESLSFSLNADNEIKVAIRVLAIGWALIGMSKLVKLFHFMPKAFASVRHELELTGLHSMKKCAELDSAQSKV